MWRPHPQHYSSRLRSADAPWGHEGLLDRIPRDYLRLFDENAQMANIIETIRFLARQDTAWILEAPSSSHIWELPELRTLAAGFADVAICMYGGFRDRVIRLASLPWGSLSSTCIRAAAMELPPSLNETIVERIISMLGRPGASSRFGVSRQAAG